MKEKPKKSKHKKKRKKFYFFHKQPREDLLQDELKLQKKFLIKSKCLKKCKVYQNEKGVLKQRCKKVIRYSTNEVWSFAFAFHAKQFF